VSAILVVSETIADFLPLDDEPRQFQCILGGSGFNTTLALQRLGCSPRLAWTISSDALGQRFRAGLAAEGADLSLLAASDRAMPVAIVRPKAASHGAMFALHLAGTAHEAVEHLPAAPPADVVHVHAASFAATTGAAAEPSLALLRQGRARLTSSYDPNIRAACLPPHSEAVALVEQRVAAATVVKASAEDLGWLYPALGPHEALQRWLLLGCRLAIATRAEHGALAITADDLVEVPAPPVRVVDTVGAGDTFTAAILAAMSSEGALGHPGGRWSGEAISRWLSFGVRAASLTCERAGCDPPRLAELRGFSDRPATA
jgi:fructokinase